MPLRLLNCSSVQLTLLLSLTFFCGAGAADSSFANPIILGNAVVTLNGPWQFHTGDDVRWAEPDFDDSNWESVDLTPPGGAHDSDVGLTGYVPGWQARGHRGYIGFAWYRIRISIESPPSEGLALSGPPYVDSAYQVFFNGQLIGEFGDFSRATTTAYGIHRPKLFPLDAAGDSLVEKQNCVIAFRVWMGSWMLGDSESGGIHIAPSLGTTVGADSRYQAQRWEAIRGYIVDAIEAMTFCLLALVACSLIPFDRSNPAYRWMAAALAFVGIARANQAVFFLWAFESFRGFEVVTVVLMIPLSLGAWTLAWYYWARPRHSAWLPTAVGTLTLILMISTILRRSWFYGAFAPSFEAALRFCSQSARIVFLILTLLVLFRVLVQPSREKWFAVPAIILMSVGLFAPELSLIHIPGIWFPFGVGVSRTEYAYAIFDIALVALLLRRLYSFRAIQAAAIGS
ncbi:MAG TPA: hypothetical protein VIY68_16855 [Steroidobacteraceae bacterium]